MIDRVTLTAIRDRLGSALAPPTESYHPLRVGSAIVGLVNGERLEHLAAWSDILESDGDGLSLSADLDDLVARTRAFDRVARALAAEGLLSAWRNERYDIAPEVGAPPWFLLERAAARYFGVRTYAAHVNGLVRRGEDIAMWITRRSATKAIDPSLLDNLVGGGIATGHTVASTLVKEAWEEAGIPADLAVLAESAGTVDICREHPDGLQRETIFVHNLWLPDDFIPECLDGEVVEHRLVPLRDVAALVANENGPDVITVDASLVIVDCLRRHGLWPDGG